MNVKKSRASQFSNLKNLGLIIVIKSITFWDSLQSTSFSNFCCAVPSILLTCKFSRAGLSGDKRWDTQLVNISSFHHCMCLDIYGFTYTHPPKQLEYSFETLCPYSVRKKKWLGPTNAIEPVLFSNRSSQTIANMCWVKTSLVGSRQRLIF